MSIKEIEERVNKMRELEDQLTNAGPARAESIFIAQSSIQEYYYADVSDLIELIDSQAKEIARLGGLLDRIGNICIQHENAKYQPIGTVRLIQKIAAYNEPPEVKSP